MSSIIIAVRGLLLSLALFALALTLQAPATLADAAVTGRTVKEIAFSAGDATPLGGFRLVEAGVWKEFNKNGDAVFSYTEQGRDDWSVYLLDESRGVEIQLDLYTRQVLHGAAGQAKSPIYNILYAMSDPPTGYTVTRVVVSLDGQVEVGSFISRDGGNWVEINNFGQVSFNFVETSRDDGSVYLHDASRGVSLQIDLVTDTVYYGENGGTLTPLYKIILEQ